jgi:hypothetical protein
MSSPQQILDQDTTISEEIVCRPCLILKALKHHCCGSILLLLHRPRYRFFWCQRSTFLGTVRQFIHLLRRAYCFLQSDYHLAMDQSAAGETEATLLVGLRAPVAIEAFPLDQLQLGIRPTVGTALVSATLPTLSLRNCLTFRMRNWVYQFRDVRGITETPSSSVSDINAFHPLIKMGYVVDQQFQVFEAIEVQVGMSQKLQGLSVFRQLIFEVTVTCRQSLKWR